MDPNKHGSRKKWRKCGLYFSWLSKDIWQSEYCNLAKENEKSQHSGKYWQVDPQKETNFSCQRKKVPSMRLNFKVATRNGTWSPLKKKPYISYKSEEVKASLKVCVDDTKVKKANSNTEDNTEDLDKNYNWKNEILWPLMDQSFS